MRRASRGRLDVPSSREDVMGWPEGLSVAGLAVVVVAVAG